MMSGGSFNYDQYKIQDVYEEIERILAEAVDDPDGYYGTMSDDVKEDMHSVMCTLMRCKIHVDRLDYLIAGDDGEETYHERLAEDLQKFETAHEICGKN